IIRAAFQQESQDNPDKSDEENWVSAVKKASEELGVLAAKDVAPVASILGAPASAFLARWAGRQLTGTRRGAAAQGIGMEGLPEAGQGAVEQLQKNLKMGMIDPSITPGQGVAESSIQEGLGGGIIGGTMGALRRPPRAAPPPPSTEGETPPPDPDDPLAGERAAVNAGYTKQPDLFPGTEQAGPVQTGERRAIPPADITDIRQRAFDFDAPAAPARVDTPADPQRTRNLGSYEDIVSQVEQPYEQMDMARGQTSFTDWLSTKTDEPFYLLSAADRLRYTQEWKKYKSG
ncbi:unnamed protein product, partial [marine sediment metagenome]